MMDDKPRQHFQATHINADGKFQSDKYPRTPAGLVPLKTSDTMAQDLLLIYADRRERIDAEFSRDLITCLAADGHRPAVIEVERRKHATEGGV